MKRRSIARHRTRHAALPAILLMGALLIAALSPLASSHVAAQGFGLDPRNSSQPIEIYANNGIEWDRSQMRSTARGDARAIQGDVTVRADTLILHYRAAAQGGQEIWRLEADGNVNVTAPDRTATGAYGVYDLDRDVMILTGAPKLVTKTDEVTAKEQIEYWTMLNSAVARGDARIVSGERRLSADVMTAFFGDEPKAKNTAKKGQETNNLNQLRRAEGSGNVHVSTPNEIARAAQGVYDAKTSIVTLTGSVRITRGTDQLNGEYGEMNLDTGISRLFGAPPNTDKPAQVRGILTPKKESLPNALKSGATNN